MKGVILLILANIKFCHNLYLGVSQIKALFDFKKKHTCVTPGGKDDGRFLWKKIVLGWGFCKCRHANAQGFLWVNRWDGH